MAANIKDPEERNRRIQLVGKYFVDTGLPTRQIASYFSENFFKISNKTVYQYIRQYMKMHPEESQNIQEKIENNTEKTITDANTRKRVFLVAKLVIEGYTINEIVDILNSSNTNEDKISIKNVEHDIFIRLKKLAKQDSNIDKIYQLVLINKNSHKITALHENRNKNIK
mgnify:FL=1